MDPEMDRVKLDEQTVIIPDIMLVYVYLFNGL